MLIINNQRLANNKIPKKSLLSDLSRYKQSTYAKNAGFGGLRFLTNTLGDIRY